jgi:hypothetical protein
MNSASSALQCQIRVSCALFPLFLYGEAQFFTKEYTELFGCKKGSLPFRYLGIPMHHKKNSKIGSQWKKDFRRNLVAGKENSSQ